MRDDPFSAPVILYAEYPDGEVRARLVTSTREAFKALTTGSKLPIDDPEYHHAFMKVVQALLNPTLDKVEEARNALYRLAAVTSVPPSMSRPSSGVARRTVH